MFRLHGIISNLLFKHRVAPFAYRYLDFVAPIAIQVVLFLRIKVNV